jgi:hypothetical protein
MDLHNVSRTMGIELLLSGVAVEPSSYERGKLMISSLPGVLTIRITRKRVSPDYDSRTALLSISAVSDRLGFGAKPTLIAVGETVTETFDLGKMGNACTLTVLLCFLSERGRSFAIHWTKASPPGEHDPFDTVVP